MKLKGKLAKAEAKEELKDTIAEVDMEITDDELDQVAGGLETFNAGCNSVNAEFKKKNFLTAENKFN